MGSCCSDAQVHHADLVRLCGVAADAVNDGAADLSMRSETTEDAAPDGAVQAAGVVEDGDRSGRHVVQVVAHGAGLPGDPDRRAGCGGQAGHEDGAGPSPGINPVRGRGGGEGRLSPWPRSSPATAIGVEGDG